MIPNSKKLFELNKNGVSELELARRYGTTRDIIHGRIYRYKQRAGIEEDYTDDDYVNSSFDELTGEVYSKSKTINTLEELIKEAQIDLEEWEITKHVINKWDVTTRSGQRFTNWQVKAWLARRNPFEIMPALNPVIVNVSDLPQRTAIYSRDSSNHAITRFIVLNDPHFGFDRDVRTGELIPYHNEKVLQIALDIVANNHFDYIVWGGDILDANEWSSNWIKRPEFVQTTQPALVEASRWMAGFIRESNNRDIKSIALMGNHDDRIEKYIIDNLPAVYMLSTGDDPDSEPLLSMSNLLGLKRMGVEKFGEEFIYGDVRLIHGSIARKGSGNTARIHIEDTLMNTVFAHVHRRELVTKTIIGSGGERQELFSMCPGCLCHTDGRVPGSSIRSNWQNGIGVLEFVGDMCLSHQIVKIDDTCIYNDAVY